MELVLLLLLWLRWVAVLFGAGVAGRKYLSEQARKQVRDIQMLAHTARPPIYRDVLDALDASV
jgi:hypothetical protein